MLINLKHIFIGLIANVFLLSSLNAQILSDISLQQKGNSVKLSWTFSSGEQCQGTWVQHGDDSLKMKTIHHVPGICGSSENKVTYEYLHENPEPNSMNYYRLRLGSRGETRVLKVYVNAVEEGFAIQGQPLSNKTCLLLEEIALGAEIKVYDITGNLQFSTIAQSKSIELRREQFRNGMHVVVLRLKDGRVFQSKLMVL